MFAPSEHEKEYKHNEEEVLMKSRDIEIQSNFRCSDNG